MTPDKTIRVIIGPTASGKAALSERIAPLLNAEIISMDSMKIYRYMDIGTAKPYPDVRARIPHHQMDILDPSESYSVAQYVEDALRIADEITARGRVPVFSGGTALYFKGITEGIFEGPPPDEALRDELKAEAERDGVASLLSKLAAVDPESATRIQSNDVRRIVRALEVYRKTGVTISSLQTQFGKGRPGYRFLTLGVLPEREHCYERCDIRVDRMQRKGLAAEARNVFERFPCLGKGPRQAVGYKEFFDVFEGKSAIEQVYAQIKLDTRHFARRQYMWFRKFTTVKWVPMMRGDDVERLLRRCQVDYPEFFSSDDAPARP